MTELTEHPKPKYAFKQIAPWHVWTDEPRRQAVERDVLTGLRLYVADNELDVDWDTLDGPRDRGRAWTVEDPERGLTLSMEPPEDDPDRPPSMVTIGATVRGK